MRDGKVLLLANPAAQRGNGQQAAQIARELLEQWLGADRVEFCLTQHVGHAAEVASQSSSDHIGTLIALGGDGLIHETVNGLMQLPRAQRPVFGVIPAGSGNDFANTLGMVDCIPDAVVQFLDAHERTYDIGCCNGEYFAETLSFGLDAAIALDTVQRRQRTGQQGTRLYLASGIDQLLHNLQAYDFTATLDETQQVAGCMHMLAVQNGPTYGGGFRICPKADPTDGLLDICYADAPMSIPVATFKFLAAKNAHHTRFKGIHFLRAARIQLEFSARPACQIDGEPHVADSFDISIAHQALDVLEA